MVIQALTKVASIGEVVHKINNEVNGWLVRGLVLQVVNRTTDTLTLDADNTKHTSGGWADDPPDITIPPEQVSTFGSKGSLGLGFATEGKITYTGTLNVSYEITWQVPVIGENITAGYVEGGARRYFSERSVVGAFDVAVSRHELAYQPMQGSWRHCARCATLNHQTDGLDAACVSGLTHDNGVSKDYFVLLGGVGGLDWVTKHCSKCECMVAGPPVVPGACAAGGQHDVSEAGWYAMVADAGAPGEPGWQTCVLCNGIVIDSGRPCPSGGTHLVPPAPTFNVWHG